MPTHSGELRGENGSAVRTISLAQLKGYLDEQRPMVLVDVRTNAEVRLGTIPGSVHIPREALELQVPKAVADKTTRLVVFCATGARSLLAAQALSELGYTDVEAAHPGFSTWIELGFPVFRSEPTQLTPAQCDRYQRHLVLPEVGQAGQAKLLASKVLIVGAGGLGSPAALYLAAAGVGTIGIVDADVVESCNLQRQILHATSRVGAAKVQSAATALADLNPDVHVIALQERLTSVNVDRIVPDFDVIVDGSDNLPTRYLINDAAMFHQKPLVHGSVDRFQGQVTVFSRQHGPCYRCLFPTPPPSVGSAGTAPFVTSCREAGVLGVLPGIIGSIQAAETIKLLLNQGVSLCGRVITFDALAMKFWEHTLKRDPNCRACGKTPTTNR